MRRAKEKLEDINVMEGIDFEKNQKKIKTFEQRKRKEKRIQNIIYGLICTIIIILILFILIAMKKDAYTSCVDNGMSAEWCEAHID